MVRTTLDGFDDLFRREYDVIVRDVFLVTGRQATATEITQDAFAEAVVHWRRVRNHDRPGAWVRRVAIRRAIKVRDRDRRRDELAVTDWAGSPAAHTGHDTPGSAADTAIDVARALDSLTATQRALVVLHYFDDIAVADAAALVGCKPSTASVHLHRARQRLGAILDTRITTDA
ncbi:MAG: sigma-70 family RNA polymerase sigma factor [Actinomycetota bacterium]